MDILPRECRSRISTGTGLFVFDKVIKKSVGFHAVDMERKTDQSVKKTVSRITDLFFSGNRVSTLLPVCAVIEAQEASEILHPYSGDHNVTNKETDKVLKTVEPYIYGLTPM